MKALVDFDKMKINITESSLTPDETITKLHKAFGKNLDKYEIIYPNQPYIVPQTIFSPLEIRYSSGTPTSLTNLVNGDITISSGDSTYATNLIINSDNIL